MMSLWWSPFYNLRWRLVIVALCAMGASGWWLSSLVAGQLHRNYQEAIEESLVDTSILLAGILAQQTQQNVLQIADFSQSIQQAQRHQFTAKIYDLVKNDIGTNILITDAQGIVLYDSLDPENMGKDFSRWNDIARTIQGRYGARATRGVKDDPSTAVLHVAAPIRVDHKLIGVVSVSKAVANLSHFMHVAQENIVRAIGAAAIIAALIALAATVWVTRPLSRLVTWAEAVKAGGRPSVPTFGGGEIGRVAQAITGLQASLDGRAYVERYVQHLTHELKSPLAGIRGAAELLTENPPPEMQQRFLANIKTEGERLQDFIDRLLELSKLERRERVVQAEDIFVADLILEIIEDFTPQTLQAQLSVRTDLELGLTIRGERFLVRQAVANLLSNAIEFSPTDTTITISASGVDRMVSITVRDQGPGIPSYACERLFERFYSLPRPHSGRKGTGLGLAFVREVADLHGGQATLQNHNNGGAEAVLRLPGIYVESKR
jgi:two-component system sensor histidine kinase CreC